MNLSNGRQPSLYDAKARVARAGEHIKSLEAEVARWGFRGPMSPTIYTAEADFPPSALCSILVGEIAYNLKAALDYLVFELFYLDTGQLDNRTKFVIEDTPEAWCAKFPDFAATPVKRGEFWLHRLTPAHQTALKGLQPFSGTEWTKDLRTITNPDRHRELIQIAGRMHYWQTGITEPSAYAAGDTEDPDEVFVGFETSSIITLGDGRHAVELMQHLQREVSKVIETFDADFEGEIPKASHDTDLTGGPGK